MRPTRIAMHAVAVFAAWAAIGNAADTLTVEPLYPVNGARWNDYVQVSDAGVGPLEQADLPCVSTSGMYSSCVHGGDKRRATLSTQIQCSSLAVADSLDALRWRCDDTDGGVVFTSVGLLPERRLADLISDSDAGWRPIALNVTQRDTGNLVASSDAGTWWTNPIRAVPEQPGTGADLNQASTIYVVDQDLTSDGVRVTANSVGLVTLGTSTLSLDPTTSVTCSTFSSPSSCLVYAAARKYLWIEGRLGQAAGTGSQNHVGVYWTGTNFSRIRNLWLSGLDMGVYLENGTHSNFISDIRTARLQDVNVFVHNGPSENVIADLVLFGGPGVVDGFRMNKGYSNVVSRVLSPFHYGGLAETQAGNDTTVLQALVSDTTYDSYPSGTSSSAATAPRSGCLYVNLVALHPGSAGIEVQNSPTTSRWINVAIARQSGDNIHIGSSARPSTMQFEGAFLFQAPAPVCSVDALSFGVDAGCQGPGMATRLTGVDLDNAVVGAVSVDDAVNASDDAGVRPAAQITDWFNFENRWRGWGPAVRPASGAAPPCTANCRIWDFRIDNKPNNPLFDRVGNGATLNEPFTPGGPCPSAATGNASTLDSNGNRFLLNAYEELEDGVGDDDGLCESGERCVYSPHFGPYQGEGSLVGPCVFANGAVADVELMAWSVNGPALVFLPDASIPFPPPPSPQPGPPPPPPQHLGVGCGCGAVQSLWGALALVLAWTLGRALSRRT